MQLSPAAVAAALLTFHDNALDLEIAQKDIDCKAEAEAFDASSGAVSRTCYLQTGDCMGDALREQAVFRAS